MIHKLKIEKAFIEPILYHEKNFEIRKNDRGFQKGDIIHFQPLFSEKLESSMEEKELMMEIANKEYEITYVMNGYGLENGYVVFGIEEVI